MTTNPLKNGYKTSELHLTLANFVVSYAVILKVLQDLSHQTTFLAQHPAIASFVGAALALSNAVTMFTYIAGRSSIKTSAIAPATDASIVNQPQ